MRMHFRLKNIDRFAGIFVILALILILMTIVFIARGQKWFAKRHTYIVIFDRVAGIKPGTDVTISGMEVGRVKSLRLNQDRKVEVILEILDEYKDFLRQDSSATVVGSLLGGKTVEITPGSRQAPLLLPGKAIPSQEPKELTDFLKGLDLQGPLKRAEATLANLEDLSAKLKDPQGELFTLLQNIEFISQQLRRGEGNIGALLQDRKLYAELRATLTSLHRAAEHLEKTSANASQFSSDLPKLKGELESYLKEVAKILEDVRRATSYLPETAERIQRAAHDLPVIIDHLQNITKDVKVVTENLKKVAPQIPELFATSQENLEEVEKLIQNLRTHWLIRGAFPKPPQSTPLELSQRENPY